MGKDMFDDREAELVLRREMMKHRLFAHFDVVGDLLNRRPVEALHREAPRRGEQDSLAYRGRVDPYHEVWDCLPYGKWRCNPDRCDFFSTPGPGRPWRGESRTRSRRWRTSPR